MTLYNLRSPNSISSSPNLDDLGTWFKTECERAPITDVERRLMLDIQESLDVLVKWPARPLLLWQGASRSRKYHAYPEQIKAEAKLNGVHCDTRTNGPAVVAYRLAGGERPVRFGSTNGWSIHHLYSGKFPHLNKESTLHAAKHPLHMTQAAGLVAIHPLADQACDEYPFFAWLLRAMTFQKFKYDPDNVFSDQPVSEVGFCERDGVSAFFAEQLHV